MKPEKKEAKGASERIAKRTHLKYNVAQKDARADRRPLFVRTVGLTETEAIL